jgi:5-methylcytosine-specific restriction endonuclease McrA
VLLKALRAAAGDQDQPAGDGGQAGVSAETSPPAPAGLPRPGDRADPARCHVEDGAAVSITTTEMIGCTAALSWMTHSPGGAVLDLGRRRRRASKAIRKAARERDHGRCRYPGCESRRVDLHHIQHWGNGGPTSLDNLLSLCKVHHLAVHDRGYLIAARPGGTFAFYAPGGTEIPPSPARAGRRHRGHPRR